MVTFCSMRLRSDYKLFHFISFYLHKQEQSSYDLTFQNETTEVKQKYISSSQMYPILKGVSIIMTNNNTLFSLH